MNRSRRAPRADAPRRAAPPESRFRTLLWAIAAPLAAAVLYARTVGFPFVNWDDDDYLFGNPLVVNLSWESLTRPHLGNHHPLTTLSYALEYAAAGLDPRLFHATNVVLHALCALAVFLLARRLLERSGGVPAAAFAALMFALHPLQVETVAWVAERKNLLSTLFYLAAMLAYLRADDADRPRWAWPAVYAAAVAAYASKGSAVTLPVALVLLDVVRGKRLRDPRSWWRLAPLFALSVATGLLAIEGQRSVGAVGPSASGGWGRAPFVAARGVVFYPFAALVPAWLCAVHPYPATLTLQYAAAPLVVGALAGALAWWVRRSGGPAGDRPLVRETVFGVVFYVLTIAPVLQFLPVGRSVVADRYYHLPGVGLAILAAAVLFRLASAGPRARRAAMAGGALALAAWAAVSHARIDVWSDGGLSLWNDVLAKHPGHVEALTNRSALHASRGDAAAAYADLDAAAQANPDVAVAFYNRGCARLDRGDLDGGFADLDRAIALDPGLADAYNNRGWVFLQRNDPSRALADYDSFVRLRPGEAMAYANRAIARERLGDARRALDDLERAKSLGAKVSPELEARLRAMAAGAK